MTLAIFLLLSLPVLFGLAVYMYKEAHTDRVVCHEWLFPGFPKSFGPFRFFFITDVHKRLVSEHIIKTAEGKADFVVIGGDLLEKGVPLDRVEKNIIKLKTIGPVYFVWGNNDYETDVSALKALLKRHGAAILDNKAAVFESPAGERVVLLGVDDAGKKRDRLDLAMQAVEPSGFRILISHNPCIVRKIKPEHQIELVLSGHTHGGQIRIFGIGLCKKGGIKKMPATTLFVSNGYGTTKLPFRLGAKAETHLITIKSG